MLTSELDYDLPDDLIAHTPASPRDSSRLMLVNAATGDISHHVFRDLPNFLTPSDALILNETKVIPARLEARRPSGGATELLFLKNRPDGWETLARPGKKLRPGMVLTVGSSATLDVVKPLDDGHWLVRGDDVAALLDRFGKMPLPPYIAANPEKEESYRTSYQTVYAKEPGSAAAPTAGLHFTEDVLRKIETKGTGIPRVTLHVGTGTFSPVRSEDLTDHTMHSEYYEVPGASREVIPAAGRVVSVGTTVARTLETWATSGIPAGKSDIFIYPGYRWKLVDALVTNFHLPRSTLLAMVMSFGGKELLKEAYREAIAEKYRFYSFGDAMFIVGGGRSRV